MTKRLGTVAVLCALLGASAFAGQTSAGNYSDMEWCEPCGKWIKKTAMNDTPYVQPTFQEEKPGSGSNACSANAVDCHQ